MKFFSKRNTAFYIAMLIVIFIYENNTDLPSPSPSPEDSKEFVNQKIMSMINESNKQLPKMIDSETQLTLASGYNNLITYHYKLVNLKAINIDQNELRAALEPDVVKSICSLEQINVFTEQEINFKYVYSDIDNIKILEVLIDPLSCAN